MPKEWKWKLALVLASLFLGIYFVIPTAFKLNQIWAEHEAKGTPVPWYLHLLPSKAISLGLDLRGGIYIEMQVDLASAIKRHADYMAGMLERQLDEEKITPVSISQPLENGELHLQLKDQSEMTKAEKIIDKNFRKVLIKKKETVEDGNPTLVLDSESQYASTLQSNVVERSLETIRNRIDRYGVAEPTITLAGGDRIVIELPGLKDPERAINIIKMTGQLEFKIVNESVSPPDLKKMITEVKTASKLPDDFSLATTNAINEALKDKLPANTEIAFEIKRDPITKKVVDAIPYLLNKKVELTGDMLKDAHVDMDSQRSEPYISIALDKKGTQVFADVTTNNVGKKLAIVLDGNVNSAPVIQEPITGGSARITLYRGDFNAMSKEAHDLALVLQEGSLPASLTEASKNVIGPSLGQDTIETSLKAALLAALLVVLFMIFYYKISGFYADVALALNVLLIFATLALFGATLTLPGIAGIVLTMGMAVDANVLICERIREELALGKTIKSAVDSGYSNALRAVVDSNITTLIAGLVLYQFGTGPIKGFAVTLSIGILTTLYTAVVVTRLIYDYRIIKHKIVKLSI